MGQKVIIFMYVELFLDTFFCILHIMYKGIDFFAKDTCDAALH